MLQLSHKIRINASMDRVAAILADFAEMPRKYDGTVMWSRIIEQNEDSLTREVCRPALDSLPVTEHVTKQRAKGLAKHTYRNGGDEAVRHEIRFSQSGAEAVAVEFVVHLPPGNDLESSGDISALAAVTHAAARLKRAAENPVVIPAWITSYYDAVDRLDLDVVIDHLSDDCSFQVGNFIETRGKESFRQSSEKMWSALRSIKHNFLSVTQDGGKTVIEVLTEYSLKDGRHVAIPAAAILGRTDDKISSVRIYADMAPMFHGWPTLTH